MFLVCFHKFKHFHWKKNTINKYWLLQLKETWVHLYIVYMVTVRDLGLKSNPHSLCSRTPNTLSLTFSLKCIVSTSTYMKSFPFILICSKSVHWPIWTYTTTMYGHLQHTTFMAFTQCGGGRGSLSLLQIYYNSGSGRGFSCPDIL